MMAQIKAVLTYIGYAIFVVFALVFIKETVKNPKIITAIAWVLGLAVMLVIGFSVISILYLTVKSFLKKGK